MACVSPISSADLKRILASRAFARVGEPKRNRAIFAMQLCLGPRIHELLALRCGDVLYSTGALRPTIYFRKTKTAVPRRIEANNPLLIRYLQPWIFRLDQLGILHAGTWLFPGRSWDKPLTRQQVYAIYKAAYRELGLVRLGTHSPRKTWAVATYDYWLRQQRAGRPVDPLVMTQRIGGWKSLESCSRYLGFTRRDGAESQFHLYQEAGLL